MSSVKIELMSSSPLVRLFNKKIIQNIRRKNLVEEKGEVIHGDLVPKFSERIVHRQMGEKIIPPRREVQHQIINRLLNLPPRRIPLRQVQRPMRITGPQIKPQGIIAPPTQKKGEVTEPIQDYGKINGLLNDPSVSVIECGGPSKKIMVSRVGMRQMTNIVLSEKEIKEILDKIADKAHVPLSEGVFKAAVDHFSINAVVSEIIGSRFVIRKDGPYNLLEGAGAR